MRVVLFSGGQGLRLRGVYDVPKPLVEIGGKNRDRARLQA
jgi:choline kinase